MARKAIPPQLREQVWMRDNGDAFKGMCFVCQTAITFTQMEVGHIIPVSVGGSNTIDNLKSICSSCNKSMGTMNLFDYKKNYFIKKPEEPSLIEIERNKRKELKQIQEKEKEKIKKQIKEYQVKIKELEKIKFEEIELMFCENIFDSKVCGAKVIKGTVRCQNHSEEKVETKKTIAEHLKNFIRDCCGPSGEFLDDKELTDEIIDYVKQNGGTQVRVSIKKVMNDIIDRETIYALDEKNEPIILTYNIRVLNKPKQYRLINKEEYDSRFVETDLN